MAKIKHTQRGFGYIEFKEKYGLKCSLQKSSAASEDCIWLGIDEVSIIGFNGTQSPTIKIGNEEIKKAFNVSDITNSRMHLTKKQVAKLLPFLQKFVKTGEIQ